MLGETTSCDAERVDEIRNSSDCEESPRKTGRFGAGLGDSLGPEDTQCWSGLSIKAWGLRQTNDQILGVGFYLGNYCWFSLFVNTDANNDCSN